MLRRAKDLSQGCDAFLIYSTFLGYCNVPVSSFALHTNEEPIGWLNGKYIDESCRVS